MLVSVEQGSANPSIGTLLKLSDALGVGLPALVEPPVESPIRVTRRGQGAILWEGAGGGRAQLMAGTTSPDVIELWDWTLGPGDEHRSDPHAGGTRELIHVLDGTVTVECADRSECLATGDAMSFPGDVSHAYINGSAIPARFALTVFEPDVGLASSTSRTDTIDA
jgi:transcriptional regulator with XRE-family HTH domain